MNWAQLLKKSFPYLILVFIAFLLMGAVGFYSAGEVTRRHWAENAENSLRTAEANVAEGLARSELMLLNAYHASRRILDNGGGNDAVVAYLTATTNWMGRAQDGAPGFYGLYAYINGEFVDGINLNPESDFIPEDRPWYKAAQSLGIGEVAYTDPYIDWRTGGSIVTAVQKIYSSTGDHYYGVLAMDIDLAWFAQYIQVLSQSSGGYGMLLNRDLRVISYPYEEWLGFSLDDMGTAYAQMSVELLQRDSPQENPVAGYIPGSRTQDSGGREMRVFIRQIFNGWYLILHIPLQNYYRDIYSIQINPAFVGLILIVLFSLVMLRINAAQIRSDEISAYKTTFLAHISHEIRTPMNALIGMSELALREHRQTRIMEYLGGIKQAGMNLLSIVNDILDISKIEAGTLQITPASYFFASLINDVVSIIRVELAEKPLIFSANVDPAIPNVLLGDEARIRQVLLNLLSNAVKYTQRGYIDLKVQIASREGRDIVLRFDVADSGLGIRKEDQIGIFESFVRLDEAQRKGIEGTGLGLVISRRLCRAMGGDVSVTSEYGKGSVFTAAVTQTVLDSEPLAAVDHPQEKRVLVYEERESYAKSVLKSLEDLGVYAKGIRSPDEFYRELEGGYTFALVSSRLIREAVDKIREKGLSTTPVFLADPGDMVSHNNIPMLLMPAYSVPLANVLNNRTVFERRQRKRVRFIVPASRILIVDDSATNLKVAEGLLSLYRAKIDTCFDGRTSLDLVMKNEYDLVFMDHTMPEMDGIQATAEIRGMLGPRFKTMPIIALTANAIAGMREMFLANGFSDYLSKPIEIAKLDEIIAKWIPREKQIITGDSDAPPRTHGEIQIEGLDIAKGMSLVAAETWADYAEILQIFCRDAEKRIDLAQQSLESGDLTVFAAQMHSLKGDSASIGADALSQAAKELELAGKAGDRELVRGSIGQFCEEVSLLTERIKTLGLVE